MKKVLEEEMMTLPQDDPELAMCSVLIIARLRKMMDEGGPEDDEEVLQTKIISPKEVAKEWEKWKAPAGDEVHSLLTKKMALIQLDVNQVDEFMKMAKEKGLKVELIPRSSSLQRKPENLQRGRSGGWCAETMRTARLMR